MSYWVVDSGASRHICYNASLFKSIKPIAGSTVTLPDHSSIQVNFCGDIRPGDSLVLEDVLYIPDFKFNLISVSCLLAKTTSVINFCHNSFINQKVLTNKMIGKRRKVDGLYILDASSDSRTGSVNQVSVNLWHSRLGHPSVRVMELLKDHLQYNVFQLDKCKSCLICPLAKQRRLAFISNHNVSASPFDLMHCNVWGPITFQHRTNNVIS